MVQILVVVANIQMRILETEVGKGSARTVFVRGLADPKIMAKAFYHREIEVYFFLSCRKGSRLIFLRLDNGLVVARQPKAVTPSNSATLSNARARDLFSS